MPANRELGLLGEEYACSYLTKKGFHILARNYRYRRLGEIDIIAQKGEDIHFIEVKTRSSNTYGSPSQSVDRKKQTKIEKVTMIYCSQNNLKDSVIRFDVIEIMSIKDHIAVNVIWDAFF